MVATVVATRARERAVLNRRSRITAVDEATLLQMFEAKSFPVRAFAARVKIPKDRLIAARSGKRVLSWEEVRRLARACAKPGADAAELSRIEELIWKKTLEAAADCVKREKLDAELNGGAL